MQLARMPYFLVALLFASSVNAVAMDFDYQLNVNGDGSTRAAITVNVSNVNKGKLYLVYNATLIDDIANHYGEMIPFVNDLSIRSEDGTELSFTESEYTVNQWHWPLHPIYFKRVLVDVPSDCNLVLQYHIGSNVEICNAIGLEKFFWNSVTASDFWHGYLENILLRPEVHSDLSSAMLSVTLPPNWSLATVYPVSDNIVSLGRLPKMYSNTNSNLSYQRAPFVLYNSSKYNFKKNSVRGVELIDVYPADLEGIRNQEAFYTAFTYLCDNVGVPPTEYFLTFLPGYGGGALFQVYQSAPYGYPHSLRGEFNGTGGDFGFNGQRLEEVPLWTFSASDPDQGLPHFYGNNLFRTWEPGFIQFESDNGSVPWSLHGGLFTYYDNICAAQVYGIDPIVERRFKPMYRYYKEYIVGDPENNPRNEWGKPFLSYYKPALVLFWIDGILKEQSNGDVDINSVMRKLYLDAENGEKLTLESFREALNSLTGYNFDDIVTKYLEGSGNLTIDDYLENPR